MLTNFVEYIIIGVAMLTGAIIYVILLWGFLRIRKKVPSPFNFDKFFWTEFKKFGTLYVIGDFARIVVEGLVVGFTNAIVLRVIAMILTVIKGGFFGRFRNFMIGVFNKKDTEVSGFRKFMGDTLASLIFWMPIYVIQLLVLYAFHLLDGERVVYAIILGVVITLTFGRLGCFLADLVEKYILRTNTPNKYYDPLGEFGSKPE